MRWYEARHSPVCFSRRLLPLKIGVHAPPSGPRTPQTRSLFRFPHTTRPLASQAAPVSPSVRCPLLKGGTHVSLFLPAPLCPDGPRNSVTSLQLLRGGGGEKRREEGSKFHCLCPKTKEDKKGGGGVGVPHRRSKTSLPSVRFRPLHPDLHLFRILKMPCHPRGLRFH